MADAICRILFSRQKKRFREIEDMARFVAVSYSGNPIIREGIFSAVENYTRKRDIPVEVLRYPFHDNELWAFTFLKEGTIFLCEHRSADEQADLRCCT